MNAGDAALAGGERLGALRERERELAVLDRAIDAAAGGAGAVVLVEGPAGIGKTSLLRAACARAAGRGLRVLEARGGELERDFGFGVVRSLLARVIATRPEAERGTLLAGAAALGAAVLGAVEDPQLGADPSQAALHGLYWLVANLSDSSPLLLAIDDAHWADDPSLRFLQYLGTRVEGIPVLILVAARPAEQLDEVKLRLEPPVLRPAPLSEEASREEVRAVLGADVGKELCTACHRATGGNPFFLSELLVEIQSEEPGAATPDSVAERGPERIARSVLGRIGRLDPAAPRFARALAVLGPESPLRRVAGLAEIEPGEASRIADLLAGTEVVAAERPLSFVHPVVRTAIYDDVPAGDRAALHRAAADLLSGEGAPSGMVASHLLATEPGLDESVVARLRAAARDAQARGAPDTAARYLRRAVAEPPPAPERGATLLELGTAEFLSGQLEGAEEHLEAAIVSVDSFPERLAATQLLAGLLAMTARPSDGVAAIEARIAEVAEDDPQLAAQLGSHALNFARISPISRRSVADWRRRLAERVAAGDEEDPLILASVAADMAMAGDPVERMGDLAERALAAFEPADFAVWSGWAPYVAVRCLGVAERFDLTREALDVAIRETGAGGAAPGISVLSCYRSELQMRLGELSGAEQDARTALDVAVSHGPPVAIPAATAWLADALTEQGELEQAMALLAKPPFAAPAATIPDVYTLYMVLAVRGRLRLAERRFEQAAEDLLELGRRLNELGELNPALMAWRRNAASALAALGDLDGAGALAGEELQRARAFGGRRAIGAALRVAGEVGGGEAGLTLLEEAAALLSESPARLERARSLVALGAARRRAGQRAAAREPLAAGMDLADRCGAAPLSDLAREELLVIGARPRRRAVSGREALTASELRVAELAASGMTNKEIAQSLFVTLRTIEMHLSNAYRKLGIGSRQELGAALGA
ncbi:MAG TPA: AAA family ATPase [Solirubrobacterales bacterium]|nr:AAA family ATPase [Solirubrobacterales bacterium]